MKKIKFLIFLLILTSCNQYYGKVDSDYIPKNEAIEIFSNYKEDIIFSEVDFGEIIFPKFINPSIAINDLRLDKIINTEKSSVINFINNKIFITRNKSLHLIDINNQNKFEFKLNLDKDEKALHIFEFNKSIYVLTNRSRLSFIEGRNMVDAAKFDLFTNVKPILSDNKLIIITVFGDIFEINLESYSISKINNFVTNPGISIKSNIFEDKVNLYHLFNEGTLLSFKKNNYEYYKNYILEDLNILTSLGVFKELVDAPFNHNGNLYFLDQSGKISVFNPITLEIFWEINLNNTILKYLFSKDGYLIILTLDKILILSDNGKIINSYTHDKESPILIFSLHKNIYLVCEDGIYSINIGNNSEDSFYKNKFTNNLEIYFEYQNIYLKDDKSLFKLSE